MWLSSAVLLPLGIFFTYKAVNDSAVFNPDAYLNFFRRIIGMQQVRHLEMKEIVMDEVVPEEALMKIRELNVKCEAFLEKYKKKQSYLKYLTHGYDRVEREELNLAIEDLVSYLENSRQQLVINKVADLPVLRDLFIYQPAKSKNFGMLLVVLFPVGLLLYIIGVRQQSLFKGEIKQTQKVCGELKQLLERNM